MMQDRELCSNSDVGGNDVPRNEPWFQTVYVLLFRERAG